MKTKRGFTILMTLFVIVMLVGCSKQEAVQTGPSAQNTAPSAFVSSLPSVRDSVTNSYSSADIFLSDVLTNLGGSRLMNSPPATIASSVKEKARAFGETLSSIDLIMSDFNSNRAGIDSSRLSSSDSDLLQTIEGKLARYSSNKDKMLGCLNSVNAYSEFVDLTMQREDALNKFYAIREEASNYFQAGKFDEALAKGPSARGELLKCKNIDVARSKMNIVPLDADVIKGWDLHLEAQDLILRAWSAWKNNDQKTAVEKEKVYTTTFTQANDYGAKELPNEEQAKIIDTWLKNNVETCKGVLS